MRPAAESATSRFPWVSKSRPFGKTMLGSVAKGVLTVPPSVLAGIL
jgi:hypothetical protein